MDKGVGAGSGRDSNEEDESGKLLFLFVSCSNPMILPLTYPQ